MLYWRKNNTTEESPKIKSHKYGKLTFDKVAMSIQWGKKIIFSTNGAGTI